MEKDSLMIKAFNAKLTNIQMLESNLLGLGKDTIKKPYLKKYVSVCTGNVKKYSKLVKKEELEWL